MSVHEHGLPLTSEQREIVQHESGPALVVAGAGTGKTTVMLSRIRRLVRNGIRPNSILMVTFSKRCTSDMKQRAARLAVPRGADYRTLHSVAYAIVMDAHQRGYFDRTPIVPKDWQTRRVVADVLKEVEGEIGKRQMKKMPKPREIFAEIDIAKANMIWPDQIDTTTGEILTTGGWYSPVLAQHFPSFNEWASTRYKGPMGERVLHTVERCYSALDRASRAPESFGFDRDAGSRWVTFNDMVALTARAILSGTEWVRGWYGSWDWILSDECQDNAPVNWVLIEFLAGQYQNIMAVGDGMQSIFGWRGSDPKLMHEFLDRYPTVKEFTLSTNFRSGSTILEAANNLVAAAPDDTLTATLQCGTGREGSIAVCPFGNPSQEANGVVDSIETAIRDGCDPDDIAVLYRIGSYAGLVEIAMIHAGIPYRVAGSSFFKRGEIRAIIGYLAVALDRSDEDGFKYSVKAPKRYLGNKFIEANPSFNVALENFQKSALGRWVRGVREYRSVLERTESILTTGTVKDVLDYLFVDAGVREHFREEGTSDEDETELDEAISALTHCAVNLTENTINAAEVKEGEESSTIATARQLVEYARAMATTGREDYIGERDTIPRVTLSTIHKAKGLEWPYVWGIGVCPGILPLSRADEDEERRLFYVMITRAKDRCVVTWPELSSRGQAVDVSPFVYEAKLLSNGEPDNDSTEEEGEEDAVQPDCTIDAGLLDF